MTIHTPRKFLVAVSLALVAATSGCATTALQVQPWDRDLLAEPKMRFVPYPMLNDIDEHIYFSKEGSAGGQGVGGGGCGCN